MLAQALINLAPKAQWNLDGETYEDLIWLSTDIKKPTKKQVETEIARLKVQYTNTEYQRERAKQYPSISEQLDMLWHAIDTGTLNKSSDFYLTLKAVKDANPKAE